MQDRTWPRRACIALCIIFATTTSVFALSCHDKAVGPGVVRAATASSDGSEKQLQATTEHDGAAQKLSSKAGEAPVPHHVDIGSNNDNPASEQDKSSGEGKSPVDILTLLVLVVQTGVFGLQAQRLKETIDAMKAVGADQSKDMHESLRIAAEASRASQAASETAAKQLARDSEALIARERAYYAFRSFNVSFGHVDGVLSYWVFEVVWKNYGNRPPRNIINCTSMSFFDSPVGEDFLFPDRPVSIAEPFGRKVFAAPQATIRGVRVTVSVRDLELIAKGEKYLSIWGWVEYDDGFIGTPRRRSEFAADIQMIGIVTQPSAGHANPRMHTRHNGTDDECMKPATT